MQELGSFYRKIRGDYWVYSLDKMIKDFMGREPKNRIDNFIITDVRHVNECEYVKNNKGVLIKIVRPDIQEIHGMQHESETALDDRPEDYFDIIIHNNGTLEDLRTAAKDATDAVITMKKMINKGEVYNGK